MVIPEHGGVRRHVEDSDKKRSKRTDMSEFQQTVQWLLGLKPRRSSSWGLEL